ncbi:MAG: SAM-dependent methyltransferase [Pseudomonadota bacterium]
MTAQPRQSPVISVALLSASALAYEVLLTRLFAIVHWHHFAHMVISLALLGYGVSGTLLSIAGRRWQRRFPFSFSINSLLFAVTAPLCFVAAQVIPFNPLELAWEGAQWLWFGAIYLVLSLPFLAAANAIALALWNSPERLHGVYAADLAGAGAGALGVVLLLFAVPTDTALRLIVFVGLAATLAAVIETAAPHRGRWLVLIAGLATVVWITPQHWSAPRMSPYKDLSKALTVSGAEVQLRRSNPLGEIAVVANREVPFRIAPGMSLSRGRAPPEQLALFIDGTLAGPVTALPADPGEPTYLDAQLSALPYQLLQAAGNPRPQVLLPFLGTAESLRQAVYFGAGKVAVTEENPALISLLKTGLADFTGNIAQRPDTEIHDEVVRGFLDHTKRRFDLIQIEQGGTPSLLESLKETPEATREAFAAYLRQLRPGGLLALTHTLSAPPRSVPRLLLTAIEAMEARGDDPATRLIVLRSWRTASLILKNGAFTAEEIAAARDFAAARSFDLVYLPGLQRREANRFNLHREPLLFDTVAALLGERRDHFVESYKFRLDPVTDDRPFLYLGTRWSALPELLQKLRGGGAAQIEWGYLLLLATLVQAVVLSLVLILAPYLATCRRAAGETSGATAGRIIAYFTFLGLGFLFVEIAFIHSLQRLLHHPVLAVSAVLAGFLVFAGLGSRLMPWVSRRTRSAGIFPIAAGIAFLALTPLFLMEGLSSMAADWPLWGRYIFALAVVAPMAILMGMPFPLGLRSVARLAPTRVPLAWGVNGCASVIGAVTAELVIVEAGFTPAVAVGALFYLLAATALPGQQT